MKAKTLFMQHRLLHSSYLCLIEVSGGLDIVMCGKNIFNFKGVATNNKSTIDILYVCTWSLVIYSNATTGFYHFLCTYPFVLNLLVSLIMCYIILSHIADNCCFRLLNGYGAFFTLVVGNCSWLKYLARRLIGVE